MFGGAAAHAVSHESMVTTGNPATEGIPSVVSPTETSTIVPQGEVE